MGVRVIVGDGGGLERNDCVGSDRDRHIGDLEPGFPSHHVERARGHLERRAAGGVRGGAIGAEANDGIGERRASGGIDGGDLDRDARQAR